VLQFLQLRIRFPFFFRHVVIRVFLIIFFKILVLLFNLFSSYWFPFQIPITFKFNFIILICLFLKVTVFFNYFLDFIRYYIGWIFLCILKVFLIFIDCLIFLFFLLEINRLNQNFWALLNVWRFNWINHIYIFNIIIIYLVFLT